MYLEWGNNNFKDAIRAPVRSSAEYSVYFVVDTWEEPKVSLMKMDNYGAKILCEKHLPPELAKKYMEEIGGLRGIHELNDDIRAWLTAELDKES